MSKNQTRTASAKLEPEHPEQRETESNQKEIFSVVVTYRIHDEPHVRRSAHHTMVGGVEISRQSELISFPTVVAKLSVWCSPRSVELLLQAHPYPWISNRLARSHLQMRMVWVESIYIYI